MQPQQRRPLIPNVLMLGWERDSRLDELHKGTAKCGPLRHSKLGARLNPPGKGVGVLLLLGLALLGRVLGGTLCRSHLLFLMPLLLLLMPFVCTGFSLASGL